MNPITGAANAVIVRDESQAPTVASLLQVALDRGVSVETLEKLVALHERVEAKRAEAEFASALAEFQSRCPSIPKTSTAKIVTGSGSGYSYNYAELDQISETIKPLMAELGFSFSFDTEAGGADRIIVRCKLRHKGGHTDTNRFECPTDSKAAMSGSQKQASALTYGKRQSLVAILGLTTCDPDDDGATHASQTKINANQAANIEALMTEVGADRAKFLHYMGVARIEDIPVSQFQKAITSLQTKGRKGAAA